MSGNIIDIESESSFDCSYAVFEAYSIIEETDVEYMKKELKSSWIDKAFTNKES